MLPIVDVYATRGPVIALRAVPAEQTPLYGVIAGKRVADRLHRIESLVEKPPAGTAPTNLASVPGRYVLPPEIFDILARTPPGKGGEIQLTDGLQILAREHTLHGYEVEGERYDAGEKVGFIEATVAFALKRPDLGPRLRPVLRRLLARLERNTRLLGARARTRACGARGTRDRRAAAGEASAAQPTRAVPEVSRHSCLSVADWACLRWPWNRACSSAALASPAAAGQSGVIATEHPRVRFATQDVLGRAPSPPSAT